MSFAEAELTQDGFLNGRLRVLQPRKGYRAGIDPVLLAASVPALAGERVLELGLGVGVASLCLAHRVPRLELTGVELQADYAELARRNAGLNGVALRVVEADLRRLPPELRVPFDRVLMNPPYFSSAGRVRAPNAGREVARGETAVLGEWLAAGLKRVRPGGTLSVIQPASRLPEVLAALPLLGCAVHPICPREGRVATLILVTATKGSRLSFRLFANLIMHSRDVHEADGDDYALWARDVLRNGAALPGLPNGNGTFT